MLHWDPQAVNVGEQHEQPPNDLYSYMFPYSAYRSEPFPPSNVVAPSNNDYNSNSHPGQFEYHDMTQTVDQNSLTSAVAISVPQVYPNQSFEPTLQQPEYYGMSQQPYRESGSPSSLPTSPNSTGATAPPPATAAAGMNQPQIRLNSNMFKPDYGRYVAVSLDPRHIGR
jgi:hypothetical protein